MGRRPGLAGPGVVAGGGGRQGEDGGGGARRPRHAARRGERLGLVVLREAGCRRLPARVQPALPRRGRGPGGRRLERLERGLRDGRPHLIVLDGLERVQEDTGSGRVRGELSDQTLKLLLRALAAGLGRARALVIPRFPLVDLGGLDKPRLPRHPPRRPQPGGCRGRAARLGGHR